MSASAFKQALSNVILKGPSVLKIVQHLKPPYSTTAVVVYCLYTVILSLFNFTEENKHFRALSKVFCYCELRFFSPRTEVALCTGSFGWSQRQKDPKKAEFAPLGARELLGELEQEFKHCKTQEFHLGARLRGRRATWRSKKGSEKVVGRVLRRVLSRGSAMGFAVKNLDGGNSALVMGF